MPAALADRVTVLGIANARFWPDRQGEALIREAEQALERELRARLFDRRGPRIAVTAEGELLYELARPLVEGVVGYLDLH